MLGEAHRRLERGTDVVAAVVETHGRKKTPTWIEGIETVARSSSTTAAGSSPNSTSTRCCGAHRRSSSSTSCAHQHPGQQECQAVAGRRGAARGGITVISTVNVQHLESLNDVVTQITGIEQQEKVPDEIVRAADQIELVDITPEACGAGSLTATCTHPNGWTRRCPTTSAEAT